MAHIAYQNQGIEPGVFMGLRTRNELIPWGERAFIIASNIIAIEEGETPVKVVNLVGKREGT